MRKNLSDAEWASVAQILKKNSSLSVVSDFLRRRSLQTTTPSWDAAINDRLRPAVNRGELTRSDIVSLIRDSEEYGRQHVFLFRCEPNEATRLTNPDALLPALEKAGVSDLQKSPRIVDQPAGLELVEIRFEPFSKGNYLVIKAVDTRQYKELVSRVRNGDEETVQYEWHRERAVKTIRIAPSGLTDVRIQAYRKVVDYEKEVQDLFGRCAAFLDEMKFTKRSLTKSRLYMLQNRSALSSVVRFGESFIRSKKGAGMTFVAGEWGKNMFDQDEELEAAVSSLLHQGKGRSHCDTINCVWLKQAGAQVPSSEIHTFISGRDNEFWIVPRCSRMDYEYVLAKIDGFAK